MNVGRITPKIINSKNLLLASTAALSAKQIQNILNKDSNYVKEMIEADENLRNKGEDEEIFDSEYYKAYYGIDTEMANSKIFRDDELFNPIFDDEFDGYTRYDENDIPLSDDKIYPKNELSKINTIDTDLGDSILPNSVTNPDILNDDINDITEKYSLYYENLMKVGINKYDAKTIILESRNYDTLDEKLLDTCISLYHNSNNKSTTYFKCFGVIESNIMNFLRHDLLNQSSEFTDTVKKLLEENESNYNILKKIRKQSGGMYIRKGFLQFNL